jgi:hypothetical protein
MRLVDVCTVMRRFSLSGGEKSDPERSRTPITPVIYVKSAQVSYHQQLPCKNACNPRNRSGKSADLSPDSFVCGLPVQPTPGKKRCNRQGKVRRKERRDGPATQRSIYRCLHRIHVKRRLQILSDGTGGFVTGKGSRAGWVAGATVSKSAGTN